MAEPPTLLSLLPQLTSGSPHTHALGFEFLALDGQTVTLKVGYRDDLVGDPESGVLAGGLVTALLDHAGGLSVWASLDRFEPIATLDLRIDYMRAAEPGLDLMAQATCYRRTRSIAFVRGSAYDRDPSDPVAAMQGAFILNSDGERRAGANLSRPA